MNNKRLLTALFLVYFIFAILLNSVGTVILQVINNFNVSKTEASILEAMKDISIAVVSFLVASLLPRLGFKNAIMIGLAIVTCACLLMPTLPGFVTAKALFFLVGVSFALVKVSVYSTIGLITSTKRQHASTLNLLEGFFMVGVLSGSWIFAFFIDSLNAKSQSWLNTYWLLAIAALGVLILVKRAELNEAPAIPKEISYLENLRNMLKLMFRPLVSVYVFSAFIFVLVEQSIGTWLPTFNNEILKLPLAMSVQITSIFAAASAIGRISASVVTRRISWYPVVNVCILCVALLIVLTLPLTQNISAQEHVDWFSAPIAAYIFPLLGFFLAPIYPCINSVMLTSLPNNQHAAMTGLLVIFSALGGTTGSLITGYIFGRFSGQTAFYLTLAPILLILLSLYFFKRSVDKVGHALGTDTLADKSVVPAEHQNLCANPPVND